VHEIKLPTTEVPKFGGQTTKLKHFRDTFKSLVINNEAYQLIQNLLVTDQLFCGQ
jgi:hypothetical protein